MFYHCGDGWAPARLARHDLGMPVMLCAPGPSMQVVERQAGIFLAALTKAYPVIKPDIWFGLDTPECYDRHVWAESFIKVARTGYHELELDGRRLSSWANTYFAQVQAGLISNIFRHRGHDTVFVWRKDTLMSALHVLVWMGAREIYFNGFDLGASGGRDYAPGVEKVLSPELRASNQRLFDKQIAQLAEFTRLAELAGVKCMNVTPGSPLAQFMPSCSVAEAIEAAKARLPAPGKLLHSYETPIGKKHLADMVRAKATVLPFTRRGLKVAIERAKIINAAKAVA